MDQLIRREAADDLVAFWEGDAPSEGDQVSVDIGDRLLIFDDQGLVAALDAGRHMLSAQAQPALARVLAGDDGVYVAFVRQQRYELANEGELAEEDLETGYFLRAVVQVRDAAKMVKLIAAVDAAEQTVEEWLADEIALDAAAAASDAGVDLSAAIARANEALAEHGIEVLSIEELTFGDLDDED